MTPASSIEMMPDDVITTTQSSARSVPGVFVSFEPASADAIPHRSLGALSTKEPCGYRIEEIACEVNGCWRWSPARQECRHHSSASRRTRYKHGQQEGKERLIPKRSAQGAQDGPPMPPRQIGSQPTLETIEAAAPLLLALAICFAWVFPLPNRREGDQDFIAGYLVCVPSHPSSPEESWDEHPRLMPDVRT